MAQSVEIDQSNRSSKVQQKERNELAKTICQFLESLPLGIVFILLSESRAFWFNVKRDYLALQTLDIPLKFPAAIGGEWHVTGLIDAMPNDHANVITDFEKMGDQLVFPQAFGLITQLVVPLVNLFGRPADS